MGQPQALHCKSSTVACRRRKQTMVLGSLPSPVCLFILASLAPKHPPQVRFPRPSAPHPPLTTPPQRKRLAVQAPQQPLSHGHDSALSPDSTPPAGTPRLPHHLHVAFLVPQLQYAVYYPHARQTSSPYTSNNTCKLQVPPSVMPPPAAQQGTNPSNKGLNSAACTNPTRPYTRLRPQQLKWVRFYWRRTLGVCPKSPCGQARASLGRTPHAL